jgi:hypothetical protein
LDITSRLENLSTLSPFCLYLHIHSFVQPGRGYITDPCNRTQTKICFRLIYRDLPCQEISEHKMTSTNAIHYRRLSKNISKNKFLEMNYWHEWTTNSATEPRYKNNMKKQLITTAILHIYACIRRWYST